MADEGEGLKKYSTMVPESWVSPIEAYKKRHGLVSDAEVMRQMAHAELIRTKDGGKSGQLAGLQAGLNEVLRRLDKIEADNAAIHTALVEFKAANQAFAEIVAILLANEAGARE